ncbi:MAG: hypothetical protein ACM3PY_21895 [Omnitrophica WOR_2 bacterium]
MNYEMNIRMVEEHRKELLRQADQYRLIQETLASRTPQAYFWTPIIVWVRRLLIDIGCLLQTYLRRQARNITDTPGLTPCEEKA